MAKSKVDKAIEITAEVPVIITLFLLVGKLIGVLNIGWAWVFAPLWGPVALLLLAFIVVMIIAQFR